MTSRFLTIAVRYCPLLCQAMRQFDRLHPKPSLRFLKQGFIYPNGNEAIIHTFPDDDQSRSNLSE
jgi:hypothetical protein